MILVYFHSLTGRVRVRRLWIILSIVMSTAAFAGEFTGKVIGVADGDTITVLHVNGDTKTPVKVRLAGIDTPEKAQDYGAKAKKALSSQIHGESVKVVYTEKDRYGRTIGDVYWGNHWINYEMVAAGWAWHYKQYSKDKRLADAEVTARKGRKGLWADPNEPIPPWEYRRALRGSQRRVNTLGASGLYWLNTGSETRHNSSCKYFKNTKRGRVCRPSEGKPCGGCGG
jgi:endonuclease YncB( thermonuclease family)